jgi:hypothetical protein
MTGADPAAFADIAARAQVFEVAPGGVRRHGGGPDCDPHRPTAL